MDKPVDQFWMFFFFSVKRVPSVVADFVLSLQIRQRFFINPCWRTSDEFPPHTNSTPEDILGYQLKLKSSNVATRDYGENEKVLN